MTNAGDRATLERWVRAPTTQRRVALRSQIVLLLDEGRDTLTRDRPGRGRKRVVT
jgi:hypothetical protein